MKKFFLGSQVYLIDLCLLLLRLTFGGLIVVVHGWAKLQNLDKLKEGFPNIMGMGIETSLYLAIFAEFVCGAFIVLGLFTRLASIPLIITMAVAVMIIHSHDGIGKMELGIIYGIVFIVLLLAGPGKFSVDRLIKS